MSLISQLIKITSKSAKRIGRGYGSGKGGHTSSRGQKGQKSRVGSKVPLWFEGGQLPIIKRMPMIRGKARFNSLNRIAQITFNDLRKLDDGVVSLESLKLNKIIAPGFRDAKLVKSGELTKKIVVKGLKVTKGAREVIEKLGGSIE
ncbi:MAG: 50S ribosomal protein L15 [Patescibacteria group bacterium]